MLFPRIVLLIALSLVAPSACADEASKRDRILRYYEASGVLDSIDRNFVAMVQQSRKMYAGYPAEFWAGHDAIFRQYKSDLVDLYVDVALGQLSDRELDELLAFTETETGRRILSLNRRLGEVQDERTAELYGEFMDRLAWLVTEYAPR